METNVLVAASHVHVRKQLGKELKDRGYQATLCGSGAEALRFCESISVNVALIDSKLPDMNGSKLRLKILEQRPDCQVVQLTNFGRIRATPDQLRFGNHDYVLSIGQILELMGSQVEEGEGNGIPSLSQMGHDSLINTIDVLVSMLELEDHQFSGSSHNAAKLAAAVTERMIGDASSVQEVVLSTLLRDIGRVGLPRELTQKEGELTDEERTTMREHVNSSVRLLEHIQFPWKVLPIIRHHHERYDGNGYPDGLRGREVPLGSRIVSVIDSYVAMTSPRNYRDAKTPEQAIIELMEQSGHQFDPEVVEILQYVLNDQLHEAKAKKPRVLLVDADAEFSQLVRLKLVNDGYAVAAHPNFEEALRDLLHDSYNMVLIDLDEDTDGAFRFLEEIRSSEAMARIPVVFLSRRDDRMLRLRALREGIDDFIDKGGDFEEFTARVSNIFSREAIRANGRRKQARKGIYGNLENLSLPDIIQTLVVGMKTACVAVTSNERKGKIYFSNGQPTYSEAGKKKGENAFFEMVCWSEGDFVIEHGVEPKRSNLTGDAMYLLMEGLRRLDEGARAKAG